MTQDLISKTLQMLGLEMLSNHTNVDSIIQQLPRNCLIGLYRIGEYAQITLEKMDSSPFIDSRHVTIIPEQEEEPVADKPEQSQETKLSADNSDWWKW